MCKDSFAKSRFSAQSLLPYRAGDVDLSTAMVSAAALLCAVALVLVDQAVGLRVAVLRSARLPALSAAGAATGDKGQWELSLRSPCKLNFFLRILGRRPTGFHDLASLFQAISLSDYMYFTKLPSGATEDVLTCSDKSLSVDKSNLVIKALNLMRHKTGKSAFFKVHLEKIVPMQAGLGGGSGNAATAMFAFNSLTGLGASNDQLKEWSGDIGSDITFFFSTGTAYCTGRGEVVEPLPPLPFADETLIHVFKPAEGLSTALVFKALDLGKVSQINADSLLDCFESNGAIKAAEDGRLVNDLEPPAFACAPSLKALKSRIEKIKAYKGVMMSGSGTSIYAVLPKTHSKEASQLVAGVLQDYPNVQHFSCQLINKPDRADAWFSDLDYASSNEQY